MCALAPAGAQVTEADIDEMVAVNVKSALFGMQAVLPHFQARERGHIINVSSRLGRIPSVLPRSAYNWAKHALNGMTANWRDELAATHPGIAVSLVSPGLIYTDFGQHALHDGKDRMGKAHLEYKHDQHVGSDEDDVRDKEIKVGNRSHEPLYDVPLLSSGGKVTDRSEK